MQLLCVQQHLQMFSPVQLSLVCCCFCQQIAVAVQVVRSQLVFASLLYNGVVQSADIAQRVANCTALFMYATVQIVCNWCVCCICQPESQTARNSVQGMLEARAGVEPTYTDLQTRHKHARPPRTFTLHSMQFSVCTIFATLKQRICKKCAKRCEMYRTEFNCANHFNYVRVSCTQQIFYTRRTA